MAANTTASMSLAVLDPKQSQCQRVNISPLHSASLQATTSGDAALNPHPPWRSMQDPEDRAGREVAINQDYLSPLKLVQLTGEHDLKRVSYLEITINTTESSQGNFGSYLPNLAQLRLTSSTVPCVRDLGTSLSSVKILWMACCKLKDLDGIPALPNLQEFYLAFNDVEDVSVITMLSSLEVLDLESNNISERDQLGYLSLCPSLTSVTLEGNPLSIAIAETTGSESGYRAAVSEAVPGVKILDDIPLEQEEGRGVSGEKDDSMSRGSLFLLSEAGVKKDWHILHHSIKQGATARPRTAPSHRSMSLSPPPPAPVADESSELTHGLNQVICGNPVRALRARKQHSLTSPSGAGVTTHPHYQDDLLHEWSLNPVYEDDIITRTKSEEKLFVEEETQQTDHLPKPKGLPTPPQTHPPLSNRLPTPPKTSPPIIKRLLAPSKTSPPTIKRLFTPSKTSPPTLKRLPTPPDPSSTRPKSVADFRHRRYRKQSTDSPKVILK